MQGFDFARIKFPHIWSLSPIFRLIFAQISPPFWLNFIKFTQI